MADEPILRLGTRQSPLAVAQAEEARSRLCKAHDWPESAVELVKVRASGDKVQDRPLAEIGGKALWTKELDQWLAEGRIDAAVHSMKDVETIRPAELTIGAILPRADRRDVLVGASSIAAIPPGARLGTSAPRRAAQMRNLRPDLEVVMFRGNVATRLAKLSAGEADVTLLAKAGLDRLGESGIGTALDADEFLPAPAQGAIGIECRANDQHAREVLGKIDHVTSRHEVEAERALLARLDGTCHSPVAVECLASDDGLKIRATIFAQDGSHKVAAENRIPIGDLEALQEMGRDMLDRATPAIRALFGSER